MKQIRCWRGECLRVYENKEELKFEINKAFGKYISEFEDIPERLKDKRFFYTFKWESLF